jgi:tRNA A-37 threonylcarbamoyl transferase component Bud32
MNREPLSYKVTQLLSKNGHRRTFSFEFEGKKLWVKQPELAEENIWHTFLSLFSKVLNNNFFKPTVVTDAKESLAYEAKRLKELRENGIRVPDLLIETENYLVLEDTGRVLSEIFNDPAITIQEKEGIIIQLSSDLASMHNKGFFHSRPALRDITYKEGQIYFMDFEENLEKSLTTKEAIIRDGFLYVHTLYRKLNTSEIILTGLKNYQNTLQTELWNSLIEEGKRYRITYTLLRLLRPFLGKDAIAIYQTLTYFRNFS